MLFRSTLGDRRPGPGFPAAHASILADSPARDPIFQTHVPLERSRWQAIVIHHSGEPAGDAESLRRLHESYGYRGLGYHFLIGNGNGLGDGHGRCGDRGEVVNWSRSRHLPWPWPSPGPSPNRDRPRP